MLPAMTAATTALRAAAAVYYFFCGTRGDTYILGLLFLLPKHGSIASLPCWSSATFWAGVVTVAALLLLLQVVRPVQQTPSTPNPDMARPLLFPCTTTHTRFFPRKHSFAYSYLLVGIPVRWRGHVNGIVSADSAPRAWYHVDPSDYLTRGDSHLGLRGKLDCFLKSEGLDPARYPYAYLVTAARFLGYHFNPVSFWYLYSDKRELVAMILEVNNTFDERRMYLLGPGAEPGSVVKADGQPEAINPSKAIRQADGGLKSSWPKDFHVSPFNSRKGDYSLTAQDPFRQQPAAPSINNTINLGSSKGHPKLVARIFSRGDAVDPSLMTLVQKTLFLARWWWVGFVTFPRIVKEAGVLFFARKLHVWFRPEPLRQSIGRHADPSETELEPIFGRYLEHLVSQAVTPLTVEYIPSGVPGAPAKVFKSPRAGQSPEEAQEMTFKVLTPAFYTRFPHYAHDLEAVFCELHESQTIFISRPELLPKLVFKKPPPAIHTTDYLDYVSFAAIKRLRQRPERIERPLTSSQTSTAPAHQEDIRSFRLSSMDGYVLSEESHEAKSSYRAALLRLFVADYVALGSEGVLWLECLVLRAILAWLVV